MLNQNRALLRIFLETRDDLEYFWPDYGTIVFPKLKQGSVSELCRLLRNDFDTSVVPGEFFEYPDHFRMGVGCNTSDVRAALLQLGKGLDRYNASFDVRV